MSKIDYGKKANILKLGIQKQINQISHSIYANQMLDITGEVIPTKYDYDTAIQLRGFLIEKYGLDVYEEAEKINRNFYDRLKRLRVRIRDIISNYDTSAFITLTFTDKVLAKTSARTRRRYVQRFLQSQSNVYVANVDYGKKNGREHYHAVINNYVNLADWEKYGFASAEKIHVDYNTLCDYYNETLKDDEKRQKKLEIAEKRLSKYVSKLCNHAIKETTKRSALIYSRDGASYVPIRLPRHITEAYINKKLCKEWLDDIDGTI